MNKQILSCDWGTSSFRLRLVQVDNGNVLNEAVLEKGIAVIYEEWLQVNQPERERINFYRMFLQSVIDRYFTDEYSTLPLIISGMASSTIGMKELPYREAPFDMAAKNLITELIEADDICPHDILLVSGLKTNYDVMRGEETMLLGCAFDKNEEALVIFPGTHSKHVIVKNNIVIDFKTFMTGEMFDLLATKSILSKSIIKNSVEYKDAFAAGVKEGSSANMLNSAFHVRTNDLFNKFNREENYYFLSGLVIGYELKETISTNKNIYLVCSNNLSENYIAALKILDTGNSIKKQNADEVLIKGHCKLMVGV